jgi:hypothetical protein
VAVEGGEQLAAAGVDGGADGLGRVPVGERHQVEAWHGDHRQLPGLRERLGAGHADAQAGEQARAGADGDAGERTRLHPSVVEDPAHRWRQQLGVGALVADRHRGAVARLVADGHAGDRRGGVDAEHEHARASGSW